jgi:TRAP-type C4-dicarboxylate transport system permease small subunit
MNGGAQSAIVVAAPPAPRAAPAVVRRLLERWHRAECALAVAAFAFIAGVLILDVLGREVLYPLLRALGLRPGATGVYGASKLAVFALVFASYAGLGIATATGSHLVPRIAFGVVPARWAPMLDRLADALTCAVLLGAAWYGTQLVADSYATSLRATVLQWPVWPFQLALPLGFASAALRYGCYAGWPALRPQRPDVVE